MENIDRTSLLRDILDWKAELGLPSEPRATKSLEVVTPIFFEVIRPIIRDYRKTMEVFADLFESSHSVATVNVGPEEFDLETLEEAVYELDRNGGNRPEVLDELMHTIDVQSCFRCLKANTAAWINLDFHLHVYFGPYGYKVTFEDTVLWDSAYANRPDANKRAEMVTRCLEEAFGVIQMKMNMYA